METENVYQEMMEVRLKVLAVKMDLLKAKADTTNAEANMKYYKLIRLFRSKQEMLRHRFHELKESQYEAREELKAGVYIAWDDLKYALNRAISRFKKRRHDALTSSFLL